MLFIGDIFGKPGREIVRRGLPALIDHARRSTSSSPTSRTPPAGFGITGDIADALFGYGVDVMTSGNHVWDKKEVLDYIPRQPQAAAPGELSRRRARPRQLPGPHPHRRAGRRGQRHGARLHDAARRSVRRRARARSRRCARRRASSSWTSTPRRPPRRSRWAGISTAGATAVLGTHTHVQTADERVLPKGTACITDVGMTGPHDSIIGVERRGGARALPQRACRRGSNRPPAPPAERGRRSPPIRRPARRPAIERLNLSHDEIEALAASHADPTAADASHADMPDLCSTSHSKKTDRLPRGEPPRRAAPPRR